MDWKSLQALVLRAPLCSANKGDGGGNEDDDNDGGDDDHHRHDHDLFLSR